MAQANLYYEDSFFKGKTFTFTGRIPGLTRKRAMSYVLLYGGHVSVNLTKHTDFLVVGRYKKPFYFSRKLCRALHFKNEGLPIHVMSSTDFCGSLHVLYEPDLFE